jgi:hypothetical protein
MLTAAAHIETDRASRYLVQLCRHGSQMGRRLGHRPRPHGGGDAAPEVRHVEWSDTRGIVTFSWGQCTLEAAPDGLTLRAEAADEDNLRRIQDGMARRVEMIGRRDNLKVNWQQSKVPTLPSSEESPGAPSVPMAESASRRNRGKILGLSMVGVLVIAAHLAAGGAMLSDWRWAGWATAIVLAVALVKVGVIGSLAARRRRASRAR